jgi:hypothetical protein
MDSSWKWVKESKMSGQERLREGERERERERERDNAWEFVSVQAREGWTRLEQLNFTWFLWIPSRGPIRGRHIFPDPLSSSWLFWSGGGDVLCFNLTDAHVPVLWVSFKILGIRPNYTNYPTRYAHGRPVRIYKGHCSNSVPQGKCDGPGARQMFFELNFKLKYIFYLL